MYVCMYVYLEDMPEEVQKSLKCNHSRQNNSTYFAELVVTRCFNHLFLCSLTLLI